MPGPSREVVLPQAIDQVHRLDPALAETLAQDFTRLARAGEALAWAHAQLPRLLAAAGPRAILAEVVAAARETTGAPRAWALTWSGDLPAGKASFEALAGDGAALASPPEISRTVLGRVVAEGRPAWSDDATQDARFRAAESVRAVALRSVGCVPLGQRGVLWLEDPDRPGGFDPPSQMRIAALCAMTGRILAAGQRSQPPVVAAPLPEPVAGLVGSAPAMVELYAAVRAFAPMPWPALILGETGTGKEAVARALHALSPRAAAPFVALNCGAVVETLAESTLFGHERGAFTGADRRQDGLLARVGRGTLLLDEVGELSPTLQVKLLRLLQEGTYERVGGQQTLRFEGRVVAATHRPLDDPDRRGGFREDLYFRLAAAVVRVPPLRARHGDLPALARHLLDRAATELALRRPPALAEDATAELAGRAWPGNVRELENALRGGLARALARGDHVVCAVDLNPGLAAAPPAPVAGATASEVIDPGLDLKSAVAAFQRARIQSALDAAGGNRTAAARSLGVSRQWLHRLLSRGGEDDDDSPPEA